MMRGRPCRLHRGQRTSPRGRKPSWPRVAHELSNLRLIATGFGDENYKLTKAYPAQEGVTDVQPSHDAQPARRVRDDERSGGGPCAQEATPQERAQSGQGEAEAERATSDR